MGPFVNSGAFWDIRFNTNDNLFLVEDQGGGTSSLYTVNTLTGQATLVGSPDFAVLGLDFENGTLYGVTNDSKLISIDTTTGVGTLVANENPPVRLFAAATADPSVPEPSTLVLGLAGFAGLGLVTLRKKYRRRRQLLGCVTWIVVITREGFALTIQRATPYGGHR